MKEDKREPAKIKPGQPEGSNKRHVHDKDEKDVVPDEITPKFGWLLQDDGVEDEKATLTESPRATKACT
jgi:hypothetical protein